MPEEIHPALRAFLDRMEAETEEESFARSKAEADMEAGREPSEEGIAAMNKVYYPPEHPANGGAE